MKEGILLNELPMMTDEVLPQGHILTEEEDREMNETLARESFGVCLGEFTEAWKAGRFDGDRESHSAVIGLMMTPREHWLD